MQSQHGACLPQLNLISVMNPARGWGSGTWPSMESGTFVAGNSDPCLLEAEEFTLLEFLCS